LVTTNSANVGVVGDGGGRREGGEKRKGGRGDVGGELGEKKAWGGGTGLLHDIVFMLSKKSGIYIELKQSKFNN